MKLLITALLLLFASTISFAQDQLTLINGTTIATKIIDAEGDQIEVKKYNNLHGNSIFIPKSTIHKIIYEDGSTKIFNAIDEAEVAKKKETIAKSKGTYIPNGETEDLMIMQGIWSTKYYEAGKKVSCKQFERALGADDNILELYKKGQSQRTVAGIVGIPAGFFLGNGAASLIYGNNNSILGRGTGKSWTTLGIGILGTIITFNIDKKGQSKMLSAIRTHNDHASIDLEFKGTNNGLGLVLSF